MKRRIPFLVLVLVLVAVAVYYATSRSPNRLVLTGIVTTDEVIVSAEIQGRLQRLLVQQGDNVRSNQLLATIRPQEWQADLSFYANSEKQSAAQVAQAEAELKYQEAQTSNQIWQAEANLAAAEAQVTQAAADRENAQLTFKRLEGLYREGVESAQAFDQARTSDAAAQAKLESTRKQAVAAQAALALARSNADQVAARRAMRDANVHQRAAAEAQKNKAEVRMDYTEVHAPSDGIVDARAALEGEVVNPGQAIVTLINPDDLWVRADVEESYIDRIRLRDTFTVRLPSGATRPGRVFYRSVDADYATQRDVSRTKRDIKTFEVRLRVDNADRRLAVGMTAYVLFPVP